MLKKISVRIHPKEVEITQYFSREPFVSHPSNHCVQLLDVLHLPNEADYVILVLPLLRPYGDPWFESVGEAVEFFRQVFEVCCDLVHSIGSALTIGSGPSIYSSMPHCA